MDDHVAGVTYWGAPASTAPVPLPNPCGSGSIAARLVFYESPRSMSLKVSYATQNDMRGLELWTLSQMRDASGACPVLEAVAPGP
jgi:hypothetical protein